jgi:hypothetical protein
MALLSRLLTTIEIFFESIWTLGTGREDISTVIFLGLAISIASLTSGSTI